MSAADEELYRVGLAALGCAAPLGNATVVRSTVGAARYPVGFGMTEHEKKLVDDAAKIVGVSRAEFIRQAALERAERVRKNTREK